MPASPLLLDALSFGAAALDLVSDATSVLNCAYGLAGNFGRYGAINSNPAITTETQALAAATIARASVADAAVALADAVRSGGDVPLAAQAVLDALTLALASPADQVRVCTSLATRQGSGPVAVLCRRLAVIALAQVAANYDPTSYNDAQATLLLVTDALDAEITAAGDVGDDANFVAMRQLRIAIAADLTARGGNLAPLVERTFRDNLPALVLAALLYGDATRSSELLRRVDPVNPLFMPTSMQVLAS